MPTFIDLSNHRFGRLVAVKPGYHVLSSGRRMVSWTCRCDCSAETDVLACHLRAGKTVSCGCYLIDLMRKPGGERKKWPGAGPYWAMLRRCYNPNVKEFPNYGARGISVCDRWRFGEGGKSGFECFFEDMMPPNGLTLDRIDVNGNYEPLNCRWASVAVQFANMRRSIHAVIAGHKIPLIKYAARTGFNYEVLRVKVKSKGMTVTEAARSIRHYHQGT